MAYLGAGGWWLVAQGGGGGSGAECLEGSHSCPQGIDACLLASASRRQPQLVHRRATGGTGRLWPIDCAQPLAQPAPGRAGRSPGESCRAPEAGRCPQRPVRDGGQGRAGHSKPRCRCWHCQLRCSPCCRTARPYTARAQGPQRPAFADFPRPEPQPTGGNASQVPVFAPRAASSAP